MAELTLERRCAPQPPSPISTLPVELVFEIFYLSLRWADAKGHHRKDTYPERTRLAITHVSQLWRATALRFPELWDEIYFRETTKNQFLDLALRNSQGRPLYLSIQGSKAAKGLSYILGWEGSVPSRVKGIYLRGKLSQCTQIRDLLLHLCRNLETFQMRLEAPIHSSRNTITLDELTNLREIELRGWATLSFPCIKSPFLTRLSIEPTLIPTKDCMKDLLNLLRTTSQLEYLRIEFGYLMLYVEPPLVEGADATISLPRLTTLRIASTSRPPLCTLLSALRLPPTIQSLKVRCTGRREFAAEKVMSALDIACNRHVPPPSSLHIQAPKVNNKHLSFREGIVFTAGGSAPSGVNTKPLHLEVTIKSPKLAGPRYPFDGPCDWLFSALSNAKVDQHPNLAFWRALASSPSLGKVMVWVRKDDVSFVQALRGNGETDAGEPNSLVHSQSAVGGFPALHNLRIRFFGSDAGWDITYARGLAAAFLETSRERKLDRLVFERCLSDLDEETSGILHSMSKNVEWSLKTISLLLIS